MFSALLDTSVLWPSLQRDFLLSMAAEGLYRPLWSDAILEELHEHEALKLVRRGVPGLEAERRAKHLLGRMRQAFDDALITDWERLNGSFGLPDPDDEHVVAAAVIGGAGVIVTENLKHFPRGKVPEHIGVQNGRDFATNTVSVDPERAARALTELATRRVNPMHTPIDLLGILVRRYGMVDVVSMVEPLLA